MPYLLAAFADRLQTALSVASVSTHYTQNRHLNESHISPNTSHCTHRSHGVGSSSKSEVRTANTSCLTKSDYPETGQKGLMQDTSLMVSNLIRMK